MKIAMVIPYDIHYVGGIQTHCVELAKALISMGNSVKIIALCSKKNSPIRNLKQLQIPLIHLQGFVFPTPTGGGTISGISLSPLHFFKLKRIFSEEQFDVIHLHEPLVPAVALCALSASTSVNIGTFHTYHEKGSWLYALFRPILTYWFNSIKTCIAASPAARDFVGRYFSGDYAIIPNGVDIQRFSMQHPPLNEFQDNKLNVLFVGRLERRKGFKYLLQAYHQLKKTNPCIRLIVVGPGDTKRYQEFINHHNLNDVIFVGAVSDEELPRYYQCADIFCSPVIGNESFGIVLLEAMASGKPVVASRIRGYSAVITEGQEGFLVPPKQVDELTHTLQRLIDDSQLRQTMGQCGKKTVQQYSWDKIACRVLEVYEQASVARMQR